MARKVIKSTFMGLLVLSMVLGMALSASAASYAPPAAPVINYFTSSAASVEMGDTVTLSWDVQNAESIEIIGIEKLPEELPMKGTLEAWPLASTTYVLNAYGANGTMTSATVDVNVGAQGAVEIVEFKASATQVESGTPVTLSWKLLNAKSIEIIGLEKLPEKEIPVTEGSLEAWPMATTTYVLQAVGFKGEIVSKSLTVTIVDKPVSIDSLTINPAEITLGEAATISWKASNAVKVNISGITGDLSAEGSAQVKPTEAGTKTYTVTAVGQNGDVATKSVNLVVKQKIVPKIIKFEATKTEVSRGTLVKLSWETENADGCMIVTSDGLRLLNRPANGSISLTPNVTRTYTLIAYDGQQNTVEKDITIVVK